MVENVNNKEAAPRVGEEAEKVKEESRQVLNKLKREVKEGSKETKEVSWKAVQDRFDGISNRIMELGQKNGDDMELQFLNKDGELISIRTATTDAPSLAISIMRKDGKHTLYNLYPTIYRNGKNTFDGGYTLWATEMRDGGGDVMKNLSVDQVMQSLDKFEDRLKEYETEKFNKLQQYAKNDSKDINKTLDSFA